MTQLDGQAVPASSLPLLTSRDVPCHIENKGAFDSLPFINAGAKIVQSSHIHAVLENSSVQMHVAPSVLSNQYYNCKLLPNLPKPKLDADSVFLKSRGRFSFSEKIKIFSLKCFSKNNTNVCVPDELSEISHSNKVL